jgi:uncharacterized protein (TIGR00730 family)
MPQLHSVAVFCGSRTGHNPAYLQAAQQLGRGLARLDLRLVYGGGKIGLMGAIADAALAAGGQVIGIIPEFLQQREVAHTGVQETIVTDSMHSRKQKMFALADAFVMMPGGLGTFDEIVEISTWRQLELHDKPILICDVVGSARPLLAAFDGAIEMGFAAPSARHLFEVVEGVDELLERLVKLHSSPAAADAERL